MFKLVQSWGMQYERYPVITINEHAKFKRVIFKNGGHWLVAIQTLADDIAWQSLMKHLLEINESTVMTYEEFMRFGCDVLATTPQDWGKSIYGSPLDNIDITEIKKEISALNICGTTAYFITAKYTVTNKEKQKVFRNSVTVNAYNYGVSVPSFGGALTSYKEDVAFLEQGYSHFIHVMGMKDTKLNKEKYDNLYKEMCKKDELLHSFYSYIPFNEG